MQILRKILTGVVMVLVVSLGPIWNCGAMDGPEIVELDSLAEYYEPVTFDHTLHVEMTEENCSTCHHHTLGTGTQDKNCARCHANSGEADVYACKDCHPRNRFDAAYLQELENNPTLFHTDKPGLKGAYHNSCMVCHEEMGGPTGCQDCHSRNLQGDEFFHAGDYAPAKKDKAEGGH